MCDVEKSHDDFPLFVEWPPSKLYFLDNMSCEQESSFDIQSDTEEEELPFCVITEDFQDANESYRCPMCGETFRMEFRLDPDEWVYEESKEVDGYPYHYPLCYEFKVRN